MEHCLYSRVFVIIGSRYGLLQSFVKYIIRRGWYNRNLFLPFL